MKKIRWQVMWAVAGLLAFGVGCGGPRDESQTITQAEYDAAESGEELAKEILATFDEMIAKAAELAKDKPDGAVLRPQLEELYAEYEVKMAAFNERFLKLRDISPREFGNANGYLGSNRGKHLFQKDQTLTPAAQYYNFQIGDRETMDMLSRRCVQVLEVGVKM